MIGHRPRLAAAAASVVLLVGCGTAERGTVDSPVEAGPQQNNAPAHIVNFPDGFPNIAIKCDGRTGIYTTTREAAPTVIPDDPRCTTGADR